jgi:anaerobic ribonucleoside-triphosphate reductase activating protein
MNIAGVDYTLKTQSIDIYLSGCHPPHCQGCHNPEAWDFNVGHPYDEVTCKLILEKIANNSDIVDNIFVMGGEPLDQPLFELMTLLGDLREAGKAIWLFTRYELDDISPEIGIMCDYIKTGRYVESLTYGTVERYGLKLATLNQRVWKRGVDYFNE